MTNIVFVNTDCDRINYVFLFSYVSRVDAFVFGHVARKCDAITDVK